MTRDNWGRRLRDPLIWVFILTAAVAVLGFVDMALELGQPFGGYVSYRRGAVDFAEIDANTPIWWTGVIQDRLTLEDSLLAVENLPYYPHAREVFRQAMVDGNRRVSITVTRPGVAAPFDVNVPAQRFTLAQFLEVRLPDIIMFLVFWLLALVVYTSEPGNPTNRAFGAVSALVGMVRALYVHNLFMDDSLATIVETVLQMSLPFVGLGILLFAVNFPSPIRRGYRKTLIFITVAAVSLSVVALIARLPLFSPEISALLAEIGYVGVLVLYFFGLIILTARFLWRLHNRRHLSRREQRVLRIVLGGLGVAMPMLIVTGLNRVQIGGTHIGYFLRGLDLRYLLLAVPLAFAYALVRYRSLRSLSWMFIFVILLSFSAIIAAIGAWAWTWNRSLWPGSGAEPPFITLFMAAFVSSLVWGSAASARGIFGRFFHYDRRAYDEVRDFGRLISTGSTDPKVLPADMAKALVQGLQLERAAVWLRQVGDGKLELAARHGAFPIPPAATLAISEEMDDDERRRLLSGIPLRLDRADLAPDWLRSIAGPQSFELALPLVGEEGLIGLIGFGPRWDEGIFDARDVAIAELIGRLATLYFTVSASIAELRRAPGRMAEVQDRERQRLAQELHDTIQQLLGRLPFYLSFSRDALDNQPHKVREILELCISDVEEAAATVRRIRHNLAPSELERGLAGSVAALCRQFEQRTQIATTSVIAPEVDALTTLETRFAIYRVIQQALDNVEAHAEATSAGVVMRVEDGFIAFTIRDDGRGSTEAQRRLSRERGSYGLQSMRARIEADSGQFDFHSGPEGTEVWCRVPVAPAHQPALQSAAPG